MSAAVSIDEKIRIESLRQRDIHFARRDPAVFCRHVLRHDLTGKKIGLAPYQEEWHRLMTQHRKLIIWSFVEGGKTTSIIGRLAYEIGRDVNKRFAVVGISQTAASKLVGSIEKYLLSPQYREVFPHVKPGPLWTKTAFTTQRTVYSKDPTLQAIGARGHPVGSRLDGIVLDDVLDHMNTRTAEQRKEMMKWYVSDLVGRLTDDSFVWVIGNAYYSDDFLHELALKYGFAWRRYPVADEAGKPLFPQQWTRKRIAKVEEDLGGKGSPEAMRQLYCVARSDESSRVKQSWIDACLRRGEGLELYPRIEPAWLAELAEPVDPHNPEAGIVPATTHTGVDIGVGKKKTSAKTVRFTLLRYPNGDLQVVGLEAGRWGAGEIVAGVLSDQERFSSTVAVESNGAQKFLLDNAYEDDPACELFVLPHNTGSNKNHPVLGVESVFADLARKRWIIPSVRMGGDGRLIGATPEIREWIQGMLDYTPEAHTSDFLMAAWISRENARNMHANHERPGVGITVLGAAEPGPVEDPSGELAAWAPILSSRRKL